MNIDQFFEEELKEPSVGDLVVETRKVKKPLKGKITKIDDHMVVIDREDGETWCTSMRWYGRTWKLL